MSGWSFPKAGAAKSGMMMVIWLGSLLMQRSVNGFSGEIIAATAYANTVNAFFMSIFSAYATAAGIIAGQNKGKQIFRTSKAIISVCSV